MRIKTVSAIEILDSRGNPTIQTTVVLEDGTTGAAEIPSGASTGKYEVVELRDGDPKRYEGKGVLKAVENINVKIAGTISGMNAEDQEKIDQKLIELDGTKNKSNLGANAILSASLAVARAQTHVEKKPSYQYLTKFNPEHKEPFILPIPQMNIMNGGRHANWATDIQEYMILPVAAKSEHDAIRMCVEVYHQLQKDLKALGYAVTVGDEGGFAPRLQSNEEPFARIKEAIEKAGYIAGKDFFLGVDSAASEFFRDGSYHLNREGKTLSGDDLLQFYQLLLQKYPIASFEDPFDQDDWLGFKKFRELKGNNIQIVGDDLYTTNTERIIMGINEKATNAVLIKLNQIGTLSETVKAILLAKKNNMMTIISHRSGDTEDPFIADFAVAMGTSQIKTGAPDRSEHTVKYNRLIAIEKELGERAVYAEFPFFNPGAASL
jgi:enolase